MNISNNYETIRKTHKHIIYKQYNGIIFCNSVIFFVCLQWKFKNMIDMTKEQKELLLRDLCARLPYRVVVDYAHNAFDVHKGHYVKNGSKCILNCYLLDTFISPRQNENGEYIKPYLFPLSSMTEEQEIEYDATFETIVYEDGRKDSVMTYKSFDWLNKNRFDYRGLIPMGLANDATGLNIYYKL